MELAPNQKLVHLLNKVRCVVKVVLNVVKSQVSSHQVVNISARPVNQVSSRIDSVIIVKLLSKIIVLKLVKSSE